MPCSAVRPLPPRWCAGLYPSHSQSELGSATLNVTGACKLVTLQINSLLITVNFTSVFPASILNSAIFEGKQMLRASRLSVSPFFLEGPQCFNSFCSLELFQLLFACPPSLSRCTSTPPNPSRRQCEPGAVHRGGVPARSAESGEAENNSAQIISYLI